MGFDVDQIRRNASLSDYLPMRGIALVKNGNEYECCCPFHSEKTPSFQIFGAKGGYQRYHCKGCGETGDIIEFVIAYDGVPFKEACEILGGERDAPHRDHAERRNDVEAVDVYAGWEVKRPPEDAPQIHAGKKVSGLWNPKRVNEDGTIKRATYTPSMVFPYRDGKGNLLGYVLRVEVEGGRKITPLILWMTGPDGQEGWSHGRFPEPRPFYGLDRLSKHPTWQVYIVEGEKAADALNRILAAHGIQGIAVSWQGGSKAAAKSSWKWARGRRLVFWGDADQQGEDAVLGWTGSREEWHEGGVHLAKAAGAAEIKVIGWDKEKPEGWDAADAEADKWAMADIVGWAKPRITLWHPTKTPEPEPPAPPEGGEEPPADDYVPPSSEDDYGHGESPIPHAPSRTTTEARATQQEDPEERPSNVYNLRGETVDTSDWKTGLVYNEDDKIKPRVLQNIMLFVQHHPALKGVFRWNDFARRVFVCKRPPWEPVGNGGPYLERELADVDVVRCTAFLETMHLAPRVTDTQNAVLSAAEAVGFNPVADYLYSLKWDGVPRLCGGTMANGVRVAPWAARYLGAASTPANTAFGLRWMIGAAARALRPGCKMDNMLILEGPQGLKKSTALRVLGTFPTGCFYTDEISELGSKDAALQLQGVLIVEVAELNALGRTEVNAIKAWMSKQADRFRPPFGRATVTFPRNCILAGTVNPGGSGYLRDPTGARRFWPVECTAIDLDALERDKDQLWAEAVARLEGGERWWLEDGETEAAQLVQAERYEEDPWADKIDQFLNEYRVIRIAEIMELCLHIDIERQDQRAEKRVAAHLKARGWERKKRYVKMLGDNKWVYERPDI